MSTTNPRYPWLFFSRSSPNPQRNVPISFLEYFGYLGGAASAALALCPTQQICRGWVDTSSSMLDSFKLCRMLMQSGERKSHNPLRHAAKSFILVVWHGNFNVYFDMICLDIASRKSKVVFTWLSAHSKALESNALILWSRVNFEELFHFGPGQREHYTAASCSSAQVGGL